MGSSCAGQREENHLKCLVVQQLGECGDWSNPHRDTLESGDPHTRRPAPAVPPLRSLVVTHPETKGGPGAGSGRVAPHDPVCEWFLSPSVTTSLFVSVRRARAAKRGEHLEHVVVVVDPHPFISLSAPCACPSNTARWKKNEGHAFVSRCYWLILPAWSQTRAPRGDHPTRAGRYMGAPRSSCCACAQR